MSKVVIYTSQFCPFCVRAKALLGSKKVAFEEIDVTFNDPLRQEMVKLSGRRTVPQIFIGGKPVGGYDDLKQLDDAGKLDQLLGMTTEA